jgi:TonB family protein
MKFLLVVIVIVFLIGCSTNGVSNLNARCEHGDCMIRYTLEGYEPASIDLFLSYDNDQTWIKVVHEVTGDIGESVSPGEKVIFLHNMPLYQLSNTRFRLILNNKETVETALFMPQGDTDTNIESPNQGSLGQEGGNPSKEENRPISSDYQQYPNAVGNSEWAEKRKSDTQVRKITAQDKPQQQQASNNLNNAFNNIKGGSGTTSGTGQQGDPNGSINGRGVLSGGGGEGTGGGAGGGNAGASGGSGMGSGSGMSWKLDGRSMKSTPKVNGTAPDEGTVTVDIWVDANGNVTKAIANAAKSNTSNGTLFKMAEDSARKAKFNSIESGEMQKGSIKITFKLN